jgi:2-iminoacetate synthase
MSAGSKTDPGGYANETGQLEQFEISDDRSAQDLVQALRGLGVDPIWKDWDDAYVNTSKRDGHE